MNHELIFVILPIIFIIGCVFIALEHFFKINKSGTALIIGCISWLIISIFEWQNPETNLSLMHETQEIFSIVIFLLSAMTIVEILVHYKLFDWVQEKIIQQKISQAGLFWLLGAITFICSAFLDNLTTTLIMIQIGRKIYKDNDNFLIFVINTIIAANSGGAASPIGDVTTIMLWIANKFSASQIISIGILPAMATWIVPQFLLTKKIKKHEEAEKAHENYNIINEKKTKPYWGVILIGVFSFFIPVLFNFFNLPAFLGLLTGLGVLWVFIDITAKKTSNQDFEDGQIVKIIQKVDISTLKFFVGILLAVGALSHIGTLTSLNNYIFSETPSIYRLITGNIALGGLSSILDNVPLVAAAIKMFSDSTPYYMWVLLAITAGTGGSMLVVGSAAGVAAMGQVKNLTFQYYFKHGTFPAVLGYIVGILTWCVLYFIFLS